MIASFFDMSQEVYGHVLWDVLNVHADFEDPVVGALAAIPLEM